MAARGIALMASLASLTLGVTRFLGVAYDPTNFTVLVLGSALGALIAGSVALRSVLPAREALRYGRAVEVNGIAAPGSVHWMGRSSVQLGPVEFLFGRGEESRVRMGEMHRVCVALGVRPRLAPGLGLVPRGFVLETDGASIPKPPLVHLWW